jgi:hypothetical protein
MSLDLYKAADQIQFSAADGSKYTLHGGRYGTGNGALYVTDSQGSVECNLTVNMVDVQNQLASDEFFVRCETIRFSSAPQALLDAGFFARTGRVVDAGHASPYAEVWRFAECPHGDGKAISCAMCRGTVAQSKPKRSSRHSR